MVCYFFLLPRLSLNLRLQLVRIMDSATMLGCTFLKHLALNRLSCYLKQKPALQMKLQNQSLMKESWPPLNCCFYRLALALLCVIPFKKLGVSLEVRSL